MKLFAKVFLSVAALAVVALVIYKVRKEECDDYMLTEVADQGYETAPDILFPDNSGGGSRLHYGPVLPGL